MNHLLKIKGDSYQLFGIVSSLLLHLLLLLAAVIVAHISIEQKSSQSGFVEIMPGDIEAALLQGSPPALKDNEETIKEDENASIDENEIKEPLLDESINIPKKESEPVSVGKMKPGTSINAKGYYNFSSENADTNSLNNIYAESTLNVRIKYPAGWTYIDQNRKKKLDGVTFIASGGIYNPPPYVHLAVEDKNIFMESRYKYKLETDNYTAYYNDPEELSGQVSQVFYIRTGDDEDYSIKFIMKGQDAFKALQPTFFGMIKSFKFGNSLF